MPLPTASGPTLAANAATTTPVSSSTIPASITVKSTSTKKKLSNREVREQEEKQQIQQQMLLTSTPIDLDAVIDTIMEKTRENREYVVAAETIQVEVKQQQLQQQLLQQQPQQSSTTPSASRHIEFLCRLVQQALAQGEMEAARTILKDQLDDVEINDKRLQPVSDEAVNQTALDASNSNSDQPRPSSSSSRPTTSSTITALPPAKSSTTGASASRSKKSKKGSEETAPVEVVLPPQPFTNEQIRWIAEVEILRARLVSYDIERARANAASNSDETNADATNSSSSLGHEFDVQRASKLRPACEGLAALQGQSLTARGRSQAAALLSLPISESKISDREDSISPIRSRFPPLIAMSPKSSPRKVMPSVFASVPLQQRSPRHGAMTLGQKRLGGMDQQPETTSSATINTIDITALEFQRWRRLGRAAWFLVRSTNDAPSSSYSDIGSSLILLAQHAMNFVSGGVGAGSEVTPADFAVKVWTHLNANVLQNGAVKNGISFGIDAAPISSIPSQQQPLPVDPSLANIDTSFSTPISTLLYIAHTTLTYINSLSSSSSSVNVDTIDPNIKSVLHLFTDLPAVANALAVSSSPSSLLTQFSHHLPLFHLLRFFSYTLQTLFHSLRWREVITLSTRIAQTFDPSLICENSKYAIYALEELRHSAKGVHAHKLSQLEQLRADYEADVKIIQERREQKRSQRLKREEDERLEILTKLFHERAVPLQQEEQHAKHVFESEDSALLTLREQAAAQLANEPKFVRAITNARWMMLQYYQERERTMNGGSKNVLTLASPFDLHNSSSLSALTGIDESRPVSRPVSRGGSVRDDGSADGRGDTMSVSDAMSDIRSVSSMASSGSATGGAVNAAVKRARRVKEKQVNKVVRAYNMAISALRSHGKESTNVNPAVNSSSSSSTNNASSLPQTQPQGHIDLLSLLGRVQHELGDFLYTEGVRRTDAFPLWHATLDTVCGALEAVKQRERIVYSHLPTYVDIPASLGGQVSRVAISMRPSKRPKKSVLAKVGLWPLVNAMMSCAKLARMQYAEDQNMRAECVLLGTACVKAICQMNVVCGSANTTAAASDISYASPSVSSTLLSGLTSSLFNSDPSRVKIGHVLSSLEYLASSMLSLMKQPLQALPVITLYEHISHTVVCNIFHTTNARVLKVQALLQAGLLSEASVVFAEITEARNLPHDSLSGCSDLLTASRDALVKEQTEKIAQAERLAQERGEKVEKMSQKRRKEKDALEKENAIPEIPYLNVPLYHSHYPPTHALNRPWIAYLLTVSENASSSTLSPASAVTSSFTTTSPQALLYGGYLYSRIRDIKGEWIMCLAEGISTNGDEGKDDPSMIAAAASIAAAAAEKKMKEKRRKSRPESSESTLPSTAFSNTGSSLHSIVCTCDSSTLRNMLLRAAERSCAEVVALFVAEVPPPGTVPQVVAAPVLKKGALKDKVINNAAVNDESISSLNSITSTSSRRRTAQNFPDLFVRVMNNGTVNPFAAQQQQQQQAQQQSSAMDSAVAHSSSAVDLLTALTRNTQIHVSSLVAQAYQGMARVRAAQGLQEEREYFVRRALKVVAEHGGVSVESIVPPPQSQQHSQYLQPSFRPSSPRLFKTGSLMRQASSTTASSSATNGVAEGSLLAHERSAGSINRTASVIAQSQAPTTVPPSPQFTLLTVSSTPNSSPLSWRQILTSHHWLSLKVELLDSLLSLGRFDDLTAELTVAEQEAKKLKDPYSTHSISHIHARMLTQQDRASTALQLLTKSIWREMNHAERQKLADKIAKIPGGVSAMPIPLPKANTYSYDNGSALLTLLGLLKKCPNEDSPDIESAKGRVHTRWLLEKLEAQMLDSMEAWDVKPSDLVKAVGVMKSEELRKVTEGVNQTNCTASPSSLQTPTLLSSLSLPGVVSLSLPFLTNSIHTFYLMSRYLFSQGDLPAAMRRAIVAEQLCALVGQQSANETMLMKAEISCLIAEITWKQTQEKWKKNGKKDLLAGFTEEEINAFAKQRSSTATVITPAIPPTPSSKKKDSTAASSLSASSTSSLPPRSPSPGSAMRGSSPAPPHTPGDKDGSSSEKPPSSASGKKKKFGSIAAAMEVIEIKPIDASPKYDLAASVAQLRDLPTPSSAEPKSILSILSRLYSALKSFITCGMQHTRVKDVACVLIDVHEECLKAIGASNEAAASKSLFLTPAFHRAYIAYWTDITARSIEARNWIMNCGSVDLPASLTAGNGSEDLAAPATAPIIPSYLLFDLTPSQRSQDIRRKQELEGYNAYLLEKVQKEKEEAVRLEKEGGMGGKMNRKPKESAASSATLKESGRRGVNSAPSSLPDDVATPRTLLFYGSTLLHNLSTQRIESHLTSTFCREQQIWCDVHDVLMKSVPTYVSNACEVWNGVLAEFGSATNTAEQLAASYVNIKAANDEAMTSKLPGKIVATWRKKDPNTPTPQGMSEILTLNLTLSTDVTRGAPIVAAPVVAVPTKKGKHRSQASISAATIAGMAREMSATALNPSTSTTSSSRKKKRHSNLDEVLDPRSAAQLLFGLDIGRYETAQVQCKKEQLEKVLSLVVALRETREKREVEEKAAAMAATAAAARAASPDADSFVESDKPTTPPTTTTAPVVQTFLPSEQLSFISILCYIQLLFFGHRVWISPDVGLPTLENLDKYLDYYVKEYGLQPTTADLATVERLLSATQNQDAAVLQSNGVCLFLHQFSETSVQKMNAVKATNVMQANASNVAL